MDDRSVRSRERNGARLAAGACLLAFLVAAGQSSGTSVQEVPIETLVKMAEAVVRVRVNTVDESATRIEVLTVYDGPLAPGQEVALAQPRTLEATPESGGFPDFAPGEEAIVFVDRYAGAGWQVTAGFQGKITITEGSGGELLIEGARYATDAVDEAAPRRTLDQFVEDLAVFLAWKRQPVEWVEP